MKNKKATIYDVAKLANVSLATASRVINQNENVSIETRNKVLAAIKDLNYHPNITAVELASKKNTNVAIIVPEINYTHVSHVVAGLMESAKEYGYDCLIFTTKDSKKDVLKTFAKVFSLRVNGVVVFNDSLDKEELENLIQFDIPVVSLGVDLNNVSSVSWHYKAQIIDLVNDALKREKEVYFLQVENAGKMQERMLDGIKKAYLENKKEFVNIINVKDSYKETYKKISKEIIDLPKCLIMSVRDSIALAALNAALDANKKVPEDYEFMAMLGTKYSELSRPKLSSFNINMKGLGRKGMQVLAKLIEGQGKQIVDKLEFEYIKRGSTL